MSRDRELGQKQKEELAGTTLEIVADLEESFDGLVDAYHKTGVGIQSVDVNTPRVKKLIQAFKEVT